MVPTAIASITSTVPGNNLTHRIEYDAFGRVNKETRTIPAGTTSRVTVYDAAGQTRAVTEWATSPASDASTQATQYTYDAFGRPLTITAPDHTTQHPSVHSFTYLGARQVTRRELIGTRATPADTVESYDVHGRLGSVLDANSTTTSYTYDVGNRLATVSMGGQPRSFLYDNLGLLRSETHPENGTTAYGDYDARGHAGSKTVNGANTEFDLTFTFDSAERPFQISSRNPHAPSTFRLSKEFTYAGTNADPANLTAGKLVTAKRYNYEIPGASAITVTEAYDYRDSAGRLTTKTSTIGGINNSSRSIVQDYTYNDLGLLSAILYPYTDFSGTPTWDWVLPQYTSGRFTGAGVTGHDPGQPDFTSSITYWPNGMLNVLAHNNGVTDTYAIDTTNGMPRPSQIKFEGWTGCTAPSITSQTGSDTIFYGDPKTISVTASGDSLTYQWYSGQTAITGATATSYSVPSNQTGSYWVRVANTCGHTDSATITISVRLRPPVALVADRSGASINVTWHAASGATSYQVFRESGGTWIIIGTAAATSFPDNSPPSGATLVYRVAALGNNVLPSDYSNSDIESTLTFTSVTPSMPITYASLSELLTGVNAMRWAAGDPPLSWPLLLSQPGCLQTPVLPQPGGIIMAIHLMALRCSMDNALLRLGIATTAYTDPNLSGVMIRAVHIVELQQRTDYQGDNR